jgi:hypothetical protein
MTTDKEVLIAARYSIESHAQTFICHTITNTGIGTRAQRHSLVLWVEHMLCGISTYSAWLSYNHPNTYNRMSMAEVRQGRLQ